MVVIDVVAVVVRVEVPVVEVVDVAVVVREVVPVEVSVDVPEVDAVLDGVDVGVAVADVVGVDVRVLLPLEVAVVVPVREAVVVAEVVSEVVAVVEGVVVWLVVNEVEGVVVRVVVRLEVWLLVRVVVCEVVLLDVAEVVWVVTPDVVAVVEGLVVAVVMMHPRNPPVLNSTMALFRAVAVLEQSVASPRYLSNAHSTSSVCVCGRWNWSTTWLMALAALPQAELLRSTPPSLCLAQLMSAATPQFLNTRRSVERLYAHSAAVAVDSILEPTALRHTNAGRAGVVVAVVVGVEDSVVVVLEVVGVEVGLLVALVVRDAVGVVLGVVVVVGEVVGVVTSQPWKPPPANASLMALSVLATSPHRSLLTTSMSSMPQRTGGRAAPAGPRNSLTAALRAVAMAAQPALPERATVLASVLPSHATSPLLVGHLSRTRLSAAVCSTHVVL